MPGGFEVACSPLARLLGPIGQAGNNDQRHEPLKRRWVGRTVQLEGRLFIPEVLAVIGRVKQESVVQIGAPEHDSEELTDVPEQSISVGIAVTLPCQVAGANCQICCGLKCPSRQCGSISHEAVRELVVNGKMCADLVYVDELRRLISCARGD